MKLKYLCSAIALLGAVAIGAPAFADDTPAAPASTPAKPMHKMAHHKSMAKKTAADKPMAKKPMKMASNKKPMGADAKERAETAKLNQEQVMDDGVQPK
jgi:hypothetical protein